MNGLELRERSRSAARRRTEGYTEEVGTWSYRGSDLLYVLILPGADVRPPGLVACEAWLEASHIQKDHLDLMRRAASEGWPGLYVQAPGAGDSEGDASKLHTEEHVDLLGEAARLLSERAGVDRNCFVGARITTGFAALAAARSTSRFVGWDPVFGVHLYWAAIRRLMRAQEIATDPSMTGSLDHILEEDWERSIFGTRVHSGQLRELAALEDTVRDAIDSIEPSLVLFRKDDGEHLGWLRRAERVEERIVPSRLPLGLAHAYGAQLAGATLDWLRSIEGRS